MMIHNYKYLICMLISCIVELHCFATPTEKSSLSVPNAPSSKPVLTKKILTDIYEHIGISGYGLPEEEEKLFKTPEISCPSTYGEITWESIAQLIDYLNIQSNDVFYDLGSGRGNVVLQVALTTPAKKVMGIELAPTRIKVAQEALELSKKQQLVPQKTIEFKQENFLKIPFNDATIIYMCSTCFNNELMNELEKKFKKEAKPGLKIVTFKQLPSDPAFILEKQFSLPTSWSKGSPVYVYTLKG